MTKASKQTEADKWNKGTSRHGHDTMLHVIMVIFSVATHPLAKWFLSKNGRKFYTSLLYLYTSYEPPHSSIGTLHHPLSTHTQHTQSKHRPTHQRTLRTIRHHRVCWFSPTHMSSIAALHSLVASILHVTPSTTHVDCSGSTGNDASNGPSIGNCMVCVVCDVLEERKSPRLPPLRARVDAL